MAIDWSSFEFSLQCDFLWIFATRVLKKARQFIQFYFITFVFEKETFVSPGWFNIILNYLTFEDVLIIEKEDNSACVFDEVRLSIITFFCFTFDCKWWSN